MRKNYVTLVYLPDDQENADYLQNCLEDMHVDVHSFEKISGRDNELLKDIKNSSCLIILHISDDFDYRDYIREINRANNRCQVVCCYTGRTVYQSKFSLNEIECVEGYPIEALACDICSIMVGGYRLKITPFNRKKYRNEAISLYNKGHYAWSLCLLLKVFRMHDNDIKERIGDAYAHLMNCDKAINYYSICLPTTNDEDTKGMICNNLGYLYTQTKNLEFAEKYLKLAIEQENPDALYNLGYLYETSWAFDSKTRRTKEGYELYCKVLEKSYTSEASKSKAKEKLKIQADKLLGRKNYAAAMTYYKAIGDGPKVAECLRNIKRIRLLYEERKKRMTQQ